MKFSARAIRLGTSLPRGPVHDTLARQWVRAATSIGANHREASRASSRRHFITTMEIAQREADEALYWLDVLRESQVVDTAKTDDLRDEADQIVAMLTTSIVNAKKQPK
ncbi:MAG: four helix bundle protein [Planctomycetota bacterium]